MRLAYAIKFVGDMDEAVAFHRDRLGLTLRFHSPEWSEFDTGATTLALDAASAGHPAGTVQLGFAADDLAALYAEREARGIRFTQEPKPVHGMSIATFLDTDGTENALSG